MNDDDLSPPKHYLHRDDFDCKVFTSNGEAYVMTVHDVDTLEQAEEKVQQHFKKKFPKLQIISIAGITATDFRD